VPSRPLKRMDDKKPMGENNFCGNVSEKDLAQDAVIADLRHELGLLKASQGTISGKTLASMGSILGFTFMLLSGALTMFLNGQISAALAGYDETVSSKYVSAGSFTGLATQVATLNGKLENVGEVTKAAIKSDIDHVVSDVLRTENTLNNHLEKYATEIASVNEKISQTISQSDVEARMSPVVVSIENIRKNVEGKANHSEVEALGGQVNRLITGRMQPQHDRARDNLHELDRRQYGEIVRERDRLRNMVEKKD